MFSVNRACVQFQWNWFRRRCGLSMRRMLFVCSSVAFLLFSVGVAKAIQAIKEYREFQLECVERPYAPVMKESNSKSSEVDVFWKEGYDPQAPCQFHLMDGGDYHFPHTMQQLYRCWSLWRHQANPILIFPTEELPDNEFLKGYIGALQDSIGLSMQHTGVGNLPKVPNNVVKVGEIELGGKIPFNAFARPDDAASLRDLLLKNSEHKACGRSPRISILNRKNKREWTTAHEVKISLEGKELPIRYHVISENDTFLQQIQFFSETDILIGPHGAQFTGIPFMPDCGALIEIFAEYYLPHFFGSLATASELSHGYIYKDMKDLSAMRMRTYWTRHAIRNCDVSPTPDIVENGIYTMIEKWQMCCRDKMGDNDVS